MALVKICGVNDPASLDAAVAGGARYVGFNFFPKSPRYVTPEKAAALAARVRGRIEIAAVTVDADDGLLAEIDARLAPDWLQLHGAESPARAGAVRRFARQGIIKALPIARAEDFAVVPAAAAAADILLFDAKAPPGAALPGGNGAAFDWTLLSGRSIPKPWMLSGGLHPGNVAEAIRDSGAAQVDVASGVERAPGVKDPARIAAFLDAAQARSI